MDRRFHNFISFYCIPRPTEKASIYSIVLFDNVATLIMSFYTSQLIEFFDQSLKVSATAKFFSGLIRCLRVQ